MKRLIYDIEVSPNIGFFWQPSYRANIGYENIIKERAIICISYKWEGEKKVYNLSWDSNQNDKTLINKFAKVLKEADEIVAHNGDQFDLKWIRARALKFGIDLSFPIITHDTLKIARQKFRFNSNRLDYLAQYLNVGGKIETGFNLWKSVVLDKDKDALKKMIRYCNNDVKILEDVWLKLKPYATPKLSISSDRTKCSECNGKMIKQRIRTKASGFRQAVLQCKECGKYKTIPLSIYEKQQ